MSTTSQTIVSHLERKEALAAALARDSELGERVRQLQEWQARRLATTYEDLLAESTYSAALRFFLTDLYGPHDFSPRNRELRRAWHSMERALPDAALHLLCDALELELLTLQLDAALARALPSECIETESYAVAYRAVGRGQDRDRQIVLIVGLARRLSGLTHHAWIGKMLRLARGPARVAGLGSLQGFLERGFEAFRGVSDPQTLAATIELRERTIMRKLLNGERDPFVLDSSHAIA